tara:strand:- start:328 stop:528 length:201 start_codon:yes stop_codon:yes gene_type:complete
MIFIVNYLKSIIAHKDYSNSIMELLVEAKYRKLLGAVAENSERHLKSILIHLSIASLVLPKSVEPW